MDELFARIVELEEQGVRSGLSLVGHTIQCDCGDLEGCQSDLAVRYRLSVFRRDHLRREIAEKLSK